MSTVARRLGPLEPLALPATSADRSCSKAGAGHEEGGSGPAHWEIFPVILLVYMIQPMKPSDTSEPEEREKAPPVGSQIIWCVGGSPLCH